MKAHFPIIDPDLSVVVPVYKNLDTIEPLYLRLCAVLETANIIFEIIFVDDACPQHSHKIIENISRTDSRVSALIMAQNIGQNRAILSGLSVADGLAIAIMDADLQDPPEAIPGLLGKMKEGYDVVFAGRSGTYEVQHRHLTSRLYKWTMHLLTGVPSDAGLYLVATKELIQKLLSMPQTHAHLVPMFGVTRAKMTSIPTPRATRIFGVSAYSSWKRLMMGLQAVLWVVLWRFGFFSRRHLDSPKPHPAVFRKLGKKFNQPTMEQG
jgi:glycosyltransferase involved in cell wall biosynthesis